MVFVLDLKYGAFQKVPTCGKEVNLSQGHNGYVIYNDYPN
jgi:hypothetical protein